MNTDGQFCERAERIAEIRRQIAAGTYDTPERMEAALEGFLDSDDACDISPRTSAPLRGPHRPR